MIITDRFVMLNFPKTGSSFARTVIKQLHQVGKLQRLLGRKPGYEELLMLPYRYKPSRKQYPSQHAVWCQIPEQHRSKPVMSILRDPMERLVSAFEFRHWERHPSMDLDRLKERFPHYPEISFAEFLQMTYEIQLPRSLPDGMRTMVGPLTAQYIRFFARDPMRTMLSLHDGMDLAAEREQHFAPVHFLHMEDLRQELRAFLLSMGYAESKLRFIEQHERVNTTSRNQASYFTPALSEHVQTWSASCTSSCRNTPHSCPIEPHAMSPATFALTHLTP